MHTYNLSTALLLLLLLLTNIRMKAQSIKRITDNHIANQQERMVYKQWDKKKFTPTKGFLGLNYQYWLTWALHPNYPKVDRRPLSPSGPQTIRLALALSMRESSNMYKLQHDTIAQTAYKEFIHYSPLSSSIDPLWNLYYKEEFKQLLNSNHILQELAKLGAQVRQSIIDKGVLDWYTQEHEKLKERLSGLHHTYLDRGNRIMGYHRILQEHRLLLNRWQSKVNYEQKYLEALKYKGVYSSKPQIPFSLPEPNLTDIQIAERVLQRAYSIFYK